MSKLLLKLKKKLLQNFVVNGILMGGLAGSAHLLTIHFLKNKIKA